MEFEITYGLGGGFGGETEKEIFEADNKEEAEKLGRWIAIEYAENFEGRYGIPSIEDYEKEMKDEGHEAWVEMMEDMWIVYTIKPME